MLFKRFKNLFSKLVGYNGKNKYYYPIMPGVFEECQEEMTNFFRKSKPFARGDYKELVELCLLFVTKGSEPVKFTMVRPGTLHKARWKAKLLYTLKIVLLSFMTQEEFPRAEIATETQIIKLKNFAVFTFAVYAPWWLVCPVPASAPLNDLHLVEILAEFAPHDAILVNPLNPKFFWSGISTVFCNLSNVKGYERQYIVVLMLYFLQ
ncbi:uncharacterized protein LOC143018031 [Oratosquilla oratoria]|uniref:uncharacterized protein LOC143018031 n=1 Tax=Oratosquilla oratoria TaxID=337810 RepID=UPI003F758C03